jgi:hypothetical protein
MKIQIIYLTVLFLCCNNKVKNENLVNNSNVADSAKAVKIFKIKPIETIEWSAKMYNTTFTSKFEFVNLKDSPIIILGYNIPKILPKKLSELYKVMYGRNSHFFIAYDYTISIFQNGKWSEWSYPIDDYFIRDDMKSCLLVQPKESVEIWTDLGLGYRKLENEKRKNSNIYADFDLALLKDSIATVLKYKVLPPIEDSTAFYKRWELQGYNIADGMLQEGQNYIIKFKVNKKDTIPDYIDEIKNIRPYPSWPKDYFGELIEFNKVWK